MPTRNDQIAQLALLSGDKVLGSLPDVLSQQEQERLARVKEDQRQREYEQTFGQRRREFDADLDLNTRQQTEAERHNRAAEDIQRLNAGRVQAAADKTFDINVRRLSEKMTQLGIPELKNDVQRVSGLLTEYEGKDLPGMGATAFLPNAVLSDEGYEVRQAIATVRNKLLKIRSGAAVTDPEMARLAEELGAKLGGTDREIRLAWPQIVAGVSAIESGISAGYDDDVVQTFDERVSARQGASRSSDDNVIDFGDL